MDINNLKWHELKEQVNKINTKLNVMGYPCNIEPWGLSIDIERGRKSTDIIGSDTFVVVEPVQSIRLTGLKCENIVLPSSLKAIMNNGLAYCENLKRVVLPEGTKYIGDLAFAVDAALEEVVIPSTVSKVGKSAFALCKNLKRVIVRNRRLKLKDIALKNCEIIYE